MGILRKYRQRKAQDRIAREIAARYGMLKEYEAALKGGFTPLEALEDWDMVTEEERMVFNNKDFQQLKYKSS